MRSSSGSYSPYSSAANSSTPTYSGRSSGLTNSFLNSASTSSRGSALSGYGDSPSSSYGTASRVRGSTSSTFPLSLERSSSTIYSSALGGEPQQTTTLGSSASRRYSVSDRSDDPLANASGLVSKFATLPEERERSPPVPTRKSVGITSTGDSAFRRTGSLRSSRQTVVRDTEDNVDLLERYGVRKASTGSSSTAGTASDDAFGRKMSTRDVLGSTLGLGTARFERERADPLAKYMASATQSSIGGVSGVSGIGAEFGRGITAGPSAAEPKDEYTQRLLAAHSRVDDLLRRRGLNAEDEHKYLRSWEDMPIVRELRQERRLRRLSTSSSDDSGLSEDAEPETHTAMSARLVRLDDEASVIEEVQEPHLRFRIAFTCIATPGPTQEACYSASFQSKSVKAASCVHKVFVKIKKSEKCTRTIRIPPKEITTSIPPSQQEKRTTSDKSFEQKVSLRRAETVHIAEKIPAKQPTCEPPKRMLTSDLASIQLRKVPEKQPPIAADQEPKVRTVDLNLSPRFLEESVDSCETDDEVVPYNAKAAVTLQLRRADQQLNNPPTVSQRDLLAKLSKRRAAPEVMRSTAEISIQHCSFYKLNERLKVESERKLKAESERNVRMNLRLTERAPSKATAKIILRAPPKLGFARADIIIERPTELRRTKTRALGEYENAQMPINNGKMRAMTVAIGIDCLQMRPVRKLQIPLKFMKDGEENPGRNEILMARDGLRKVNFVEVTARSNKRQRAEPVKRKVPHRNEASNIVQRIVQAEERRMATSGSATAASTPRVRCGIQLTVAAAASSGNSKHTSVRHATSGVSTAAKEAEPASGETLVTSSAGASVPSSIAPPYKNSTALSETDRRLIEKFRCSQQIPRPRPQHHVLLLKPVAVGSTLERANPQHCEPSATTARFLKRKTPPPKYMNCSHTNEVLELPSTSPAVASRSATVRVLRLPKRTLPTHTIRADFGVVLHKPEPQKRSPVAVSTQKKPWVPKWRRVEVEQSPEPATCFDAAPGMGGEEPHKRDAQNLEKENVSLLGDRVRTQPTSIDSPQQNQPIGSTKEANVTMTLNAKNERRKDTEDTQKAKCTQHGSQKPHLELTQLQTRIVEEQKRNEPRKTFRIFRIVKHSS